MKSQKKLQKKEKRFMFCIFLDHLFLSFEQGAPHCYLEVEPANNIASLPWGPCSIILLPVGGLQITLP